jgi:uncharacterized protein
MDQITPLQDRRFSRIVAPLVLATTAFAFAPPTLGAEDGPVVGKVQSINLDERSLVVKDQTTGALHTVVVGDHADLALSGGAPVPLTRIQPGALVSVRDTIYAASVRVGDEVMGTVRSSGGNRLVLTREATGQDLTIGLGPRTKVLPRPGTGLKVEGPVTPGSRVIVVLGKDGVAESVVVERLPTDMLRDFWENVRHNLFKPLLLFFYMGFLIPILRVKFEFPYVMYQALTIYLLLAIGWHGGEELAALGAAELSRAVGFMGVGFATNLVIGLLAYLLLGLMTGLRRVDRATVAGYYGSDSAGTFVTCLGVLASAGLRHRAYMPVLLAVMEIPGCLVALYLVSRLRRRGTDALGNLPGEPGYDPQARRAAVRAHHGHGEHHTPAEDAVQDEEDFSLERMEHARENGRPAPRAPFSPRLLHEVFLNPGLYLLFGGIVVGYISGLQGAEVTRADDNFFVDLFQGVLCLFLLEMGMTASRKLRDLKAAGAGFVAFGLLAPNLFATIGILVAHAYSHLTGTPFELGTYVLFSVLCGSASYIAVPAVQRLAIPEASPTLPLAASLGLTFSYNVTVGIPVYIEIAKAVLRAYPLT